VTAANTAKRQKGIIVDDSFQFILFSQISSRAPSRQMLVKALLSQDV
jgi:hypothetical protein